MKEDWRSLRAPNDIMAQLFSGHVCMTQTIFAFTYKIKYRHWGVSLRIWIIIITANQEIYGFRDLLDRIQRALSIGISPTPRSRDRPKIMKMTIDPMSRSRCWWSKYEIRNSNCLIDLEIRIFTITTQIRHESFTNCDLLDYSVKRAWHSAIWATRIWTKGPFEYQYRICPHVWWKYNNNSTL